MGKRVDCAEATVNVNNSAYEKGISCRWLSTAHFRDTAMWKRGTVQHQHCCLLGNKNQPGSPSLGNDWPHRAVLGRLFAARTAQGDQHKPVKAAMLFSVLPLHGLHHLPIVPWDAAPGPRSHQ